jgi:hypothetical protein
MLAVRCLESKNEVLKTGVADPGCLSRIPDPIFSISDPGSRVDKIQDPDPHQRIYLSIFNPKYHQVLI